MPPLRRGLGYLAHGPEGIVVPFVRSLAAARTPFLWVTARSAAEVPDGGQALYVTTIPGAMGSIHPKQLQEIKVAASAFIDEHGPGAVVLDCIDDLTLHAGLERVLRVIDDLHEEIAMRNATLVVFVDPQRTNPRTVAWLARELDSFPPETLQVGVEDRLVV